MFLYTRMLFTMGVSLYTSRVLLQALGVDDFGIYNVVAGVSLSITFFTLSLTQATQRFLNFEMGRGNDENVSRVFSLSLLVFALLGLIVMLTGWTIGEWFVRHKLVIPPGQIQAALTVLHATIITFAITFVFSVFESVVIARENMKLFAYLGVVDAVGKLIVAFLISLSTNRLVFYAWALMVVQLLPRFITTIYCLSKYPESRPRFYWNTQMFKEIFTFAGWNVYGGAVWIVAEQGANFLLNIFFGPAVNAARGIANQVYLAINNFINNFLTAIRPQMIKRFATGDFEPMRALLYTSTRFAFFMFFILTLPIELRTSYILTLWLGNAPDFADIFVDLLLIQGLVVAVNQPLVIANNATGRLKRPMLFGASLLMLQLPLGYIAFKLGMSPMLIYLFAILSNLLYNIVSFHFASRAIGMTVKEYFSKVLYLIFRAIVPAIAVTYFINLFVPQTFVGFLLMTVISVIVTFAAVLGLGVTPEERKIVAEKVKTFSSKFAR